MGKDALSNLPNKLNLNCPKYYEEEHKFNSIH